MELNIGRQQINYIFHANDNFSFSYISISLVDGQYFMHEFVMKRLSTAGVVSGVKKESRHRTVRTQSVFVHFPTRLFKNNDRKFFKLLRITSVKIDFCGNFQRPFNVTNYVSVE